MLDNPEWTRTLSGLVLGGAGVPVASGVRIDVTLERTGLTMAAHDEVIRWAWSDVIAISIRGPGKVTSGGGFIGGGFGVDGAVVGIATASLLNALTTRTSILTIVQLDFTDGELFLHTDAAEPEALRISLSPAFVAQRLAARART
jgi:hypothetical protein